MVPIMKACGFRVNIRAKGYLKLRMEPSMMEIGKMSQHNQLNWSDFLLCIGMELAFFKNGERPIQEQMICEKIESLGGKL